MPAAAAPSTRRWLSRLAWLVVLWLAGVATVASVTWLLRLLMRAAGLA